jgi:hypothetical protein
LSFDKRPTERIVAGHWCSPSNRWDCASFNSKTVIVAAYHTFRFFAAGVLLVKEAPT